MRSEICCLQPKKSLTRKRAEPATEETPFFSLASRFGSREQRMSNKVDELRNAKEMWGWGSDCS